jgi:nucleotide-binding universal stress UspA family protein
MPSVLAGIDGGRLTAAVVRAAADEAVSRGLALDLVTVVGAPSEEATDTGAVGTDRWGLIRRAGHLPAPSGDRNSDAHWLRAGQRLARAAEVAAAEHPELEIRTWRVPHDEVEDPAGSPGQLRAAELLVVGALGRNAVPPFGLRSVSRLLAKRMSAPVLVVPAAAGRSAGAPVVVGIHDRRDVDVLRTAVEQSVLRAAPLLVVLVLGGPGTPVRPGRRGVLDDVPVPPRTRVIAVADGSVAAALVRVAEVEQAQLIVIGTEGSASLAGLAPESTSREVIRLSTRPVLLVPAHVQHRHRVAPG